MPFNSVLFLFRFLPAMLLLYYLCPAKLKNAALLLGSLVFCCWGEVRFLPVLAGAVLLVYLCALAINKLGTRPAWRRVFLAVSVLGSLAPLLYFQYSGSALVALNGLFGTSLPQAPAFLLPLGLSFFSLHSISYAMDVYRQETPAERNIIAFGAYAVMFPQFAAGPVVRYADIRSRLHAPKQRVSFALIEEGIADFIFGLAQKVLLADSIAPLWADIVGKTTGGSLTAEGIGLQNASTPLVWLGLVAFGLQFYFNLAGYSRMAVGLGKMLGFSFPQNFNHPYAAASVTDFWNRWNSSVTSWFKDYIYRPLGGKKSTLPAQLGAMLVAWALTGLWYGVGINFLLWGLYFFVVLTLEKIWLLPRLKKGKIWPHFYTLLVVFVGWALFAAAPDGPGALLGSLFVPRGGAGALYFARNYFVPLLLGGVFCTPLPGKLYAKIQRSTVLRGILLAVLLVACIAYIAGGGSSLFVFFSV